MLITVAGIPVHPLLVHAVVVLIPLASLGAVLTTVRPRWSRAYGPLVAFGAVAGAIAATLAKFAGEQLEAALNIPPELHEQIEEHGRYGLYTMYASWVFAVLAVAAVVLERRQGSAGQARIVGGLATVAGIAALVLVVLAGHSGSASVWGFVTR